MAGEIAFLSKLKKILTKDTAQNVIFTTQAHTNGDGAEKTVLNLSGESGVLACIKVLNQSTLHKIITIKITIDGAAEQSLTSADNLWTATPTADQAEAIIPIGVRYKDSCVVKITSNGGTGTAYSGTCHLADQ